MTIRAAPTEVELLQISLPLARPFVTRHGARAVKDALLVRLRNANGTVGWGECAAEATPTYHPEYVDGAWAVLHDHLVPRLFAGASLDDVAGHSMAKAALRMAATDAELRDRDVSLAKHLGGVRSHVPVGVVVERHDDPERVADVAEAHVAEGYRRIKLKIAPGADVAPVDAVRQRIGREVALSADANGAYSLTDIDTLAALDVDLLEQPLCAGDVLDHATLVGRIAAAVCLDESIETLDDARVALRVRAADALCVKPGRIGGIERAVEMHDLSDDRCPRAGSREFLKVCEHEGVEPVSAINANVAVFVREPSSRPSRRGANVVALDSGAGLSNTTIQQRLVPVRLFYDFLIEEGLRESNPVGRGEYTPGRRFGSMRRG